MNTVKRRTSKPRPKPPRHRTRKVGRKRWSGDVMRRSNALDLDEGVFRMNSPNKIAASLKRSAERSRRRKGSAYQSSMSMLNFYINRAGKTLTRGRKDILERAKGELRKVFGRE